MSVALHKKALSEIRERREKQERDLIRGAPSSFEKYRESVARIDELTACEGIFLDLMRKVFTNEGDEE